MGQLHVAAKVQDIATISKLTSEKGVDWVKNSKDLHQNNVERTNADFTYRLQQGVKASL
jgi:hypothetical protein